MFAVKSTYSIKTPDGNDIPFYVAGDSIFFAVNDLMSDIHIEFFPACFFRSFENYALRFISLDFLKYGVLNYTSHFFYKNAAFWVHFVCHNDTKKVIAEVRDAQHFVKEYFRLDLPEDWHCLNVDAFIANLPVKATEWIEKCYRSLQILAINDVQKQIACRVFNEAWKILKERKKVETADKRPTVHEVLAKVGLTDDDLIQAVLNVHETKFANEQSKRKAEFDNQHNQLEDDLRQLLE